MIRSSKMRRLARGLIVRLLDPLPDNWLQSLLVEVAKHRAQKLPPADGLRFLFGLDAAFYPLHGQLAIAYDGGLHTKHRHIHYHDFFVERIQSGQRVLDIGCGIGAVAYDVAEKAGAHVIGIDLSTDNITMARQRYSHPRVEFRVGDALHRLPDGSFDVVILSNVLEHLPERSAFLRRVQKVARPSRFLIRVPVFERHWSVPLKRELGVEWRLDPTHETEYTPESFAEEMVSAGLEIVHQEVRWGEIWAEATTETDER